MLKRDRQIPSGKPDLAIRLSVFYDTVEEAIAAF
jgi:hypothetical protein